MNTKLYVGNLAASTTERELQDLFSPHGNVAQINPLIDRMMTDGKPAARL